MAIRVCSHEEYCMYTPRTDADGSVIPKSSNLEMFQSRRSNSIQGGLLVSVGWATHININICIRTCTRVSQHAETAKTSQWLSLPPITNCALQRTDFRHVSKVYSFRSPLKAKGAHEKKRSPYCIHIHRCDHQSYNWGTRSFILS